MMEIYQDLVKHPNKELKAGGGGVGGVSVAAGLESCPI